MKINVKIFTSVLFEDFQIFVSASSIHGNCSALSKEKTDEK